MYTLFVIFSPACRMFVRQGKGCRFTYNVNAAKHFSTEWSAKNFLGKMDDPETYKIIKIMHQ